MKILHTSDWHLGKMLENVSRIEEQREFVDYLCGIVEQENIDIILIAGDVFDTYNPSSAAEELFYDAVDRLCCKGKRAVVIIAGNHDNPERLCAASPLAFKNGIILLGYPASDAKSYSAAAGYKMTGSSIQIVDSGPGWLELGLDGSEHHAVIVALPYPSESRLEQVLSIAPDESRLQRAYSDKIAGIFQELSTKFRDDTVNLAMSHLFLKGGRESDSERVLQVGGALTVDPRALPEKAHFVALGHLHRPQRVKDAPCLAYYSGSPLAYSFSEAEHSKAFYILDVVPGGEPQIQEVLINCGKPLRRWSAKNGLQEAMQWCEEGRDSYAWIDLEIYTDRPVTMEEQKRLRELNPGIINIRPIVKEKKEHTFEYADRENKRIDELFKEFYRCRTGMEVSDELLSTFIEVLGEDNPEDSMGGGDGIETKIS